MLPRVAVRKMLIDGTQWGAWEPYALPLSDQLVALWTPVGAEMRWATGTFAGSFNTLHFWWPGARYFIGAHYDGERFAGCYCDVVLPLEGLPAEEPRREYVDLYLDLVVRRDRTWYTKDHETYDRAEQVIPQLRELRPDAEETLRWLETWVAAWSGPFAHVPDTLPRTDWHLLDPASPEFAQAMRKLQATDAGI
jgi:hypothetical protein